MANKRHIWVVEGLDRGVRHDQQRWVPIEWRDTRALCKALIKRYSPSSWTSYRIVKYTPEQKP